MHVVKCVMSSYISVLREGIISICVQRGYFMNNIISRGVHLLTGIAQCVAWSSSVCILKGSFHYAPVAATHLHWCIQVRCIGAQGAVSKGRNTAD